MEIAKKVKGALGYAGKTQTFLANEYNVTKSAISQKFQRGSFSIEDCESIAEKIGCKFEAYFVFDDGTKI